MCSLTAVQSKLVRVALIGMSSLGKLLYREPVHFKLLSSTSPATRTLAYKGPLFKMCVLAYGTIGVLS